MSEAGVERHFQPDENRVAVAGAPRVRAYFRQLRRALDGLRATIEADTPTTNAERRAVTGFLARLRQTLESLALRTYFPRPGTELRIDSTDSGFFHWSALLEMGADLERREAALAEIPARQELKRSMLEWILRHASHPREQQLLMMRRLYLESLAPERLFRPFLRGALEKVGGRDDETSWFWSFASYDRALNRPFLHGLYFEWDGRPLDRDPRAVEELDAVAERTAAGRASLLALATRLDELLPPLRPRIVKRLVLGPFWSPGYTQLEGALGALLRAHEDRHPFALRAESEILISERETRVGAGWLSPGRLRQVFWLPHGIDLAARGVSQLERFLVVPHGLAQVLQGATWLADHRLVALDEASSDGLD